MLPNPGLRLLASGSSLPHHRRHRRHLCCELDSQSSIVTAGFMQSPARWKLRQRNLWMPSSCDALGLCEAHKIVQERHMLVPDAWSATAEGRCQGKVDVLLASRQADVESLNTKVKVSNCSGKSYPGGPGMMGCHLFSAHSAKHLKFRPYPLLGWPQICLPTRMCLWRIKVRLSQHFNMQAAKKGLYCAKMCLM